MSKLTVMDKNPTKKNIIYFHNFYLPERHVQGERKICFFIFLNSHHEILPTKKKKENF